MKKSNLLPMFAIGVLSAASAAGASPSETSIRVSSLAAPGLALSCNTFTVNTAPHSVRGPKYETIHSRAATYQGQTYYFNSQDDCKRVFYMLSSLGSHKASGFDSVQLQFIPGSVFRDPRVLFTAMQGRGAASTVHYEQNFGQKPFFNLFGAKWGTHQVRAPAGSGKPVIEDQGSTRAL